MLIRCSGDIADLIFVFFDPMGQALCKRTLSLVEKLNEKHADRMRFYLSKADEAGHEADRQVTVYGCQSLRLCTASFTSRDRGL